MLSDIECVLNEVYGSYDSFVHSFKGILEDMSVNGEFQISISLDSMHMLILIVQLKSLKMIIEKHVPHKKKRHKRF